MVSHVLTHHPGVWIPGHDNETETTRWRCCVYCCMWGNNADKLEEMMSHMKSHLIDAEVFDFYDNENAFDWNRAVEDGVTLEDLGWGYENESTKGNEYGCHASMCFADLRKHRTAEGVALHDQLWQPQSGGWRGHQS